MSEGLMTIHLYGINHCQTVKKARDWLEAVGIQYQFHDFKKVGVNEALLIHWLNYFSLEILLNKRGTSWRLLSEKEKEMASDKTYAIALMIKNPSLIKRPVLVVNNEVKVIGFLSEKYQEYLKN